MRFFYSKEACPDSQKIIVVKYDFFVNVTLEKYGSLRRELGPKSIEKTALDKCNFEKISSGKCCSL